MKKFYLKDKKGNRVGTVVSVRHDDHVHYGVSTLNVKFDKFDPKEGTGRAALDLLTHFREGDQVVDIVQGRVREFILEHIAQNTSLPQRARNAAQEMAAASPYIQINHAIDAIEEIIHPLALKQHELLASRYPKEIIEEFEALLEKERAEMMTGGVIHEE